MTAPDRQAQTQEIYDFLLDAARRATPCPRTQDIIAATGLARYTIERRVDELVRDGRIERQTQGRRGRRFIFPDEPGAPETGWTERELMAAISDIPGELVDASAVLSAAGIRFEDDPRAPKSTGRARMIRFRAVDGGGGMSSITRPDW